MKCVVNWIPLRIRVRWRNIQPHLNPPKIILIVGVPSSQVLPGFLITAPPSVCVSAVIGVLAVWIQNPPPKKKTYITANPTWGDLFENSELKARTSLLPRFSEKRRSSFELSALEQRSNVTPSGICCTIVFVCFVLFFVCVYLRLRISSHP